MLHILFVILAMICMILFFPVSYKVRFQTEEGFEHAIIDADIYWLFRFLFFRFHREKGQSKSKIRILGIPIRLQKQTTSGSNKTDQKKKKKGKFTIVAVCDRIKELWNTKQKISAFFEKPSHRMAIDTCKKELLAIIRVIKPKTISGFLIFGMEDPYHTGQILVGISILYPFLGDGITISPDFEQKILKGDVQLRGHIQIWILVRLMWRLLLDRNIRKTFRDLNTPKTVRREIK